MANVVAVCLSALCCTPCRDNGLTPSSRVFSVFELVYYVEITKLILLGSAKLWFQYPAGGASCISVREQSTCAGHGVLEDLQVAGFDRKRERRLAELVGSCLIGFQLEELHTY